MLSEHEAKSLLDAYRIPVVPTRLAATPEAAADCARELNTSVVLKIDSQDITHKSVAWNRHQLLLRPILPEDEAQHLRFLKMLDAEDVRMRLFYSKCAITHPELARLTQIDYERGMAYIATGMDDRREAETFGVVRAITDPDSQHTEMAIIVRSDLKGSGLGRLLFNKMIRYCRERGTAEMTASVLHANRPMLALAKRFRFTTSASPEGVVDLRLRLQRDASAARGQSANDG